MAEEENTSVAPAAGTESVKKRRGRPPKRATAVKAPAAETAAPAPVVPEKPVTAPVAANPVAPAEKPASEKPAAPVARPTPAEVAAASTVVWSPPDIPAPPPVSAPAAQGSGEPRPNTPAVQSVPPPNNGNNGNNANGGSNRGNNPNNGNNNRGNWNNRNNRGNWNNNRNNRGNWNNNGNRNNNGGQPQFQPVPRDPNLPEYKLSDIHSWDNAEIVAKMMPDANAEDLGAMKRHEIIFAAIRSYLARGGAVMASGCLEVVKEGFGYLRSAKTNFLACPEDVFVPQQQIRRHALRPGDMVEGPLRDPRDRDKLFGLGGVVTVNGKTPSEAARIVHFENLTPTFPTRRIVLETTPGEYSTRVVDLFTPIGFGQRGLIVAPPRVGKTVLLQKIANAITANHPEAMLIILLIDERPEEVTDMQRNTKAMVLSSTFDEEPQHHVNVADMVIEMSRRQVENGKDVIILLDSITRLARAYNTVQPHSGKILTGGVDALALHRPKRFFGAARNIEGGGSLTIIATGLVDTGSRMDEVIFEEFKGTGNMEIVLDRGLADKRIYPAIDIEKSGTRKEDLLLDPMELEKTWGLRRILAAAGPESAMKSVLNSMKKTKSNPEFLLALDLNKIG